MIVYRPPKTPRELVEELRIVKHILKEGHFSIGDERIPNKYPILYYRSGQLLMQWMHCPPMEGSMVSEGLDVIYLHVNAREVRKMASDFSRCNIVSLDPRTSAYRLAKIAFIAAWRNYRLFA